MVTRIPARMIETTGVTPGSYSAADITVNSAGQVTSASTSSVASSGGGPKITSIVVTDSSYTNIDDTAVGLSGGYIKITGTGFVSGCSIIIGNLVATSVSFINSTEVRAQVPAQSAGTYTVYLVNPDGGVGIRVNGLNYSSTPTWTTTSPLGDGVIDTAISIQLAATSNSAVTYALQAGSTLPAGLSLSSGGLLSGTVTSITVDTTYNFTVVASDQESQDTPQAFSITISVSDPNFKNTVLLLQADTAPTIISDASTNNFDLTVAGDARASNFTPYSEAWSVYFDGTGDSLSISDNPVLDLGNSEFCIELWHYPIVFAAGWLFSKQTNYLSATGYLLRTQTTTGYIEFSAGSSGASWDIANIVTSQVPTLNAWNHIAVTRSSTDNRIRVFLNGALAGLTGVTTASIQDTSAQFTIGNDSGGSVGCTGYISNFRLVKGSIPAAYQTASTTVGISQIFVPPTQPLTAVANTSLLTCQSNRFLDSSSNGFAITRNGDAKIVSFNPFGITNTGVNGSAYFDGTGDYITVPDNANLEPLGGNFTIETWFYLNAVTTGTQICGKSWWTPFYIEGSNLVTYLSSNGSTWDIASNQVIITSVATFRWYHVAMVRNGTSIKVYVNGTETLSLTSSAALHDGSDTLTIGARGTTYLNGYVADLRFVKGTAVYTANFTPPTQPLTAIANTQLLTLQYDQPHNNHTFLDASSNQFVVTRSGNTTQGTFSPFSHTGFSLYTNGTNSYASVPYDASRSLGTGDFSIECWIQLIRQPANYSRIFSIQGGWGVAGHYGIELSMQTIGNNMEVIIAIQGTTVYGSNVIVSPASNYLNRWNHVVITRSSGVVRTFLNGALVTAGNNTTNINGTLATTFGCSQFPGDYSEMLISNFRLVRNSVPTQYQTSSTTPGAQIFTPPTNKVTTTSQGAVAGDVKLLLWQENRFIENASNVTISAFNTPRITPFGPFSDTIYSATNNGGSAYFDGTGDYLTVPHDPAVVLNNEDWTIEFWVYPTVDARADVICKGNGGSYVPYMISLLTSGQLNFNTSNSGSGHAILLYSNTGDYRLFQWNHIAVTKSGSTIRIFCQGALVATGSYSGGAMTNSLPLGIGAGSDGAQRLTGYMSNVRIIKGTALYTSAFTVPTAPPSPTTNTSLLLNFTDAAMRDSRGLAVLETVGDAKTSTVQVKYGTGSMYFDGNGDYVKVVDTLPFAFGANNFTVEFWMNATTSTNPGRIINYWSTSTATAASWQFLTGGTTLFFGCGTAGTSNEVNISGTISLNTWTHIAGVRNGNVFTLYINGTQAATTTQAITLQTANTVTIGGRNSGGTYVEFFAGYLDDLRITRGQARYTANFTPPAAKFLAR